MELMCLICMYAALHVLLGDKEGKTRRGIMQQKLAQMKKEKLL